VCHSKFPSRNLLFKHIAAEGHVRQRPKSVLPNTTPTAHGLRGSGSGTRVFKSGDRVNAQVAGWDTHMPGTITQENRDGTFDIRFDVGEEKRGVRNGSITFFKKMATPAAAGGSGGGGGGRSGTRVFKCGDRVKAQVAGWDTHMPGTITQENRNGTFDIRFDVGEEKRGVRNGSIKPERKTVGTVGAVRVARARAVGGAREGPRVFKSGDRVKAQVAGWDEHKAGTVTQKNQDGTFNIRFDVGVFKQNVRNGSIQALLYNTAAGGGGGS